MRVGLIDVDGHRFPNLCLMKLSAYHKARGDMVEWHESGKHYDLVYMSRVFTDTYSKDYTRIMGCTRSLRGQPTGSSQEAVPVDAVSAL